MKMSLPRKLALAMSLVVMITACNDKQKKVTKQEVKLADTIQEESEPPPPPPLVPPPGVKLENAVERCFTSDGLQYSVVITLRFTSDSDLTGKIESTELGTGKISTGQFTGTFNRNQFTARFTGERPVIGNSSEWTDKPWTITDKKISIPFNAKNHDSNKWEEMEYAFDRADCK